MNTQAVRSSRANQARSRCTVVLAGCKMTSRTMHGQFRFAIKACVNCPPCSWDFRIRKVLSCLAIADLHAWGYHSLLLHGHVGNECFFIGCMQLLNVLCRIGNSKVDEIRPISFAVVASRLQSMTEQEFGNELGCIDRGAAAVINRPGVRVSVIGDSVFHNRCSTILEGADYDIVAMGHSWSAIAVV